MKRQGTCKQRRLTRWRKIQAVRKRIRGLKKSAQATMWVAAVGTTQVAIYKDECWSVSYKEGLAKPVKAHNYHIK